MIAKCCGKPLKAAGNLVQGNQMEVVTHLVAEPERPLFQNKNGQQSLSFAKLTV